MAEKSPQAVAPIQWSEVKPHLEAEINAAQVLYDIVTTLSSSVIEGVSPGDLNNMIVVQEEALAEARSAAERRRQRIGDLAPLRERMKNASETDRVALESLLEDGTALRQRLEDRIRKTSYVARKTASWCDSHRKFLIEAVLRRQEGGLYQAPGSTQPPSRPQSVSASLDRTV